MKTMKLLYSGDISDLKKELTHILRHGRWKMLKHGYWQCKVIGGAIVNFYPTIGSISVQGKEELRHELYRELQDYAIGNAYNEMSSNWVVPKKHCFHERIKADALP